MSLREKCKITLYVLLSYSFRNILASIAHPNIIKFYGACIHPPRIGYLMEFCEHGDLVTYFNRKSGPPPLDFTLRILGEVAAAQRFLHSKKIIHRDLKAQNVLIAKDLGSRLMDFGLSKLVSLTSAQLTTAIGWCLFRSLFSLTEE